MVINTNIPSVRIANMVRASVGRVNDSVGRLSSGSRILNPADDAAGLAVATKFTSQIHRLDAARNCVANALSFVQTADGFMQKVDKALRRMGELATLAMDKTKASSDLANYNSEFQDLKTFVRDIQGKKMNGLNLFQGESIAVTNDAFGQTYSFNTTDLTATNYAEAVDTEVLVTPAPDDETSPSHVLTSIGAKWAIAKIRTAMEQLSTDRASSGSVMGRLHRINDQLAVLRENLDQSVSRIRDTNVAAESTNFARHQILVNSSTDMLKQANIVPEHALRLILGL